MDEWSKQLERIRMKKKEEAEGLGGVQYHNSRDTSLFWTKSVAVSGNPPQKKHGG